MSSAYMSPEEVKELPAARALLYSLGLTKEEIDKPIIAVVNSYNEICPGHTHLNILSTNIKKGVKEVGGTPLEFPSIGICDGIAMGHEGMKYSLPSREHIANGVELMIKSHGVYEGIVFISACDKNVPGHLIAAARLGKPNKDFPGLPSIFITGGPMLPGEYKGKKKDVIDAFVADAQFAAGEIDEEEYNGIIKNACPGPGSCAGLFTANSMACVTEALGMSFPYTATCHAEDNRKIYMMPYNTGKQIMKLIEKSITARHIMTEEAFENAFAVDMAIGASTNTVLHIPAIAEAAGYNFDLDRINEISEKTPNLVRLSPADVEGKKYRMIDFDESGGIPTVMKELLNVGLLHDIKTVTDNYLSEILQEARNPDNVVIKSINNSYSETGGIAILKGNLAPDGCVIKESGIDPSVPRIFKGIAKVFDSEEDATAYIKSGKVEKGQVLVIRYEGPAGGPGMREMLYPTSAISGLNLDKEVALITDGRFSGGTRGMCIGHIEPEAYRGGPISLIKDEDWIRINLDDKQLTLLVNDEELSDREKSWKRIEKEVPKDGVLKSYRERILAENKKQ